MSADAQQMLGWLKRAEGRRLVRMADVRPEYAATLRHKDRLGREEGHWMGGLTYATMAAQWGVGVRKVPGEFWNLDINADGYPCAEVACPCGGTPSIEVLGPMVACGGDGCLRHFFYDGQDVWAYNSPPAVPIEPTETFPAPRDTDCAYGCCKAGDVGICSEVVRVGPAET